jgi:hypothetical protein
MNETGTYYLPSEQDPSAIVECFVSTCRSQDKVDSVASISFRDAANG